MATIRTHQSKKGKTSFHAEVRLKGYPPQRASFDRITDARKWIQDTESAIREGRHFKTAEAKKHTFNDLAARYCLEIIPTLNREREKKERTQKVEWWNDRLGAYTLADINPALLVQCREALA